MGIDLTGRACALTGETTPLPQAPVPAMAYVAYQQWDAELLSAERALTAGTLFPALEKPFYGGRRMYR